MPRVMWLLLIDYLVFHDRGDSLKSLSLFLSNLLCLYIYLVCCVLLHIVLVRQTVSG